MNKKDKLDIIYENKDLIVINKPCGLLTVSTDKEKENTLFHKVYMYLKRKNKSNKIFIVHRLDRDTSGIVLFAKDEKLKFLLQNNWDKIVKNRNYIAVVHGKVEKESDIIISWLKETKTLLTYSSVNEKEGKKAITSYRLICKNNKYSFLDISLKTGRKNQIRVHMKDIHHPILGDKKYGKKDGFHHMYLHAYKLSLIHPITGNLLEFETDIPNYFTKLLKDEFNE